MTKVKIWEVESEGMRLCVVARNVNEAIRKAVNTKVEWGKITLKEIESVELIAEED